VVADGWQVAVPSIPVDRREASFPMGFISFSLREYIVSPEGKHRFLSGKTVETIVLYTQNHGLLLRLKAIICHLPPICHHLVSPLYKGFPKAWWQVADKIAKNIFARKAP